MENERENFNALVERTQKITEALYRVTEFFSEREPLRWQLRDDAIEIFDFLISASKSASKSDFDIQCQVSADYILNLIHRIERTLQLASSSGAYIPSINFEILRREYLSLGSFLEEDLKKQRQEQYSLESVKGLLSFSSYGPNGQINDNGHPPADGCNANRHSPTGELSDNGHNGHSLYQSVDGAGKGLKELELRETEFPPGNSVSKSNGQPILLKERKRKILALLGENKWINIHEISTLLPEFGPKSIQRDLLEMVEAGILKKTGDKRWRKYSLA